MRLDCYWVLRLAVLVTALTTLDARRVRIQPVDYDDDAYYADPQDDGSSRAVVLVGDDGYYQPQARGGGAQDNYIPATHRTSPARTGQSFKDTRTQVKEKAPPVQTIRNYNKVNDDGSFTFGYEAADGSFKEETRGTDCVVRGKYGYVDPDGNKREFTYVSGNPCDPNAAKDEDESRERPGSVEEEPENVPANYPTRPIRPLRPIATTPAPVLQHRPEPQQRPVLYQQYVQEEEEEEEPQQVLRAQPVQPVRHRVLPVRPTYIPEERPVIQSRPRIAPSTTPSYEDSRPLTITPRPLTVTPTPSRPQPPATTYRPQHLQVAVTPRPALVYSTKQIAVQPQRGSQTHRSQAGTAARDFVAEYQKFQLDNQISSTPASTTHRTAKPTTAHAVQAEVRPNSNPVYSSELVFDPASGQYKTALYQTLPQTEGDFTFNHQIQPYVHQPQPQLVNIRQLQQQSPLYRQAATTPRATQAAYQAQQAETQFQNSQQLFAQQQRARAQQAQTHPAHAVHATHATHAATAAPTRTEPQQFYYIQPQALQGVSGGQIDAFLRGHNIQY